ncbi:GYD domain-containing protein [Leisingera sp. S232]|uniref:GYD domain-containing protein n=1 Tax=Leisingera sp. S232 TaxID=3415132 RepID=UPI003C7DE28C
MPRFTVTGHYTPSAMKAMIENPSNPEAAARGLAEAAGGTLESVYLTTGDQDFAIKVMIDDISGLLAGLLATGASGTVCNLRTMRAVTSDAFTEIQKKAGGIAAAYRTPGGR